MVRHLPQAGWSHRWEPTAATPRMQLLVGAYLLLAGLFELVLATLSNAYVRQSTLAAVQRTGAGLTAEQARAIVATSVGVGIAAAVLVALVYILLGALTLASRPIWLFYCDLVVLGLVALGVPLAIYGLLTRSAGPIAFTVPNLLLSIVALVLFLWMLLARFRVGPWACLKTSV